MEYPIPSYSETKTLAHIRSIYNDISEAEWALQAAEREYAFHCQKAGWSNEICARVEFLKEYIKIVKDEIESLQAELYSSN